MGGAADLKEIFPQIKIVLGKRDLEMIGDGEKSMSNAVAPYAKPFTPDILVKEGDQITSGNTVFTVMDTHRAVLLILREMRCTAEILCSREAWEELIFMAAMIQQCLLP